MTTPNLSHCCKHTEGLHGVLSLIDAADQPVEGQPVTEADDTEPRRILSQKDLDDLVSDIYGYVEYILGQEQQ